jgi:hypothetical protein
MIINTSQMRAPKVRKLINSKRPTVREWRKTQLIRLPPRTPQLLTKASPYHPTQMPTRAKSTLRWMSPKRFPIVSNRVHMLPIKILRTIMTEITQAAKLANKVTPHHTRMNTIRLVVTRISRRTLKWRFKMLLKRFRNRVSLLWDITSPI